VSTWIYDQAEVVLDLLDATCSREQRRAVGRLGAPELAVHEDHPVAADDALPADEPLRADGRRPARDADPARESEPEQQHERSGDADRDREGHLVRLAGGVEQHDRAAHEHDPTGDRERAVRHLNASATKKPARASGRARRGETGRTWRP
jgi:hypothetical protein